MSISCNVKRSSKPLFALTQEVKQGNNRSKEEGEIEVEKKKAKQNACLFFTFFMILSSFPIFHANANPNIDEFPLGMVLEYQKHYTHMSGPIDVTYTVRFEVTSKVEGYASRYVVVQTVDQNSGTEIETFYEDYPNGTLTAHQSAPLSINLTSWIGLETATLASRVYNVSSVTSAGCNLHYEAGKDEDTITYESHGILSYGYYFHFDLDNPFGTNSLSTKLVSSNLNSFFSFEYSWLLTTLLLPAIAIEVIIIAWLLKKRKSSSEL
jgi:hypothetical protein